MKRKSILVVSNNPQEIDLVTDGLMKADADVVLTYSFTGRHALNTLMGGYQELKAQAVEGQPLRPDAIIMSKNLSDMPAFELLSIIRKYQSLSRVKCYVITDNVNQAERSVYDGLVTGYLFHHPANDEAFTKQCGELLAAMNGPSLHFPLLIGFFGNAKLNWPSLKAGSALLKTAACVGVVGGAGAIAYTMDEEPPQLNSVVFVAPKVHPELLNLSLPAPAEDSVKIIPEFVPGDREQLQTQVISAEVQEDSTVVVVEELPKVDTPREKKKFSIGVKPLEGTK